MINFEKQNDEFEALLNEYMPIQDSEEIKRKVIGTIVNSDRNFTYLEVSGEPKAVRVRTSELYDHKLGDEVEVMIITQIEEDDSLVLIGSKKRIEMEIGAEKLNEIYNNKEIVEGKIVKKVNGGYIVEVLHQQAFLPNSLSNIPANQSNSVVGQNIDVVVKEIKEDKKGKKILLSRKEILIEKENEIISNLSVGDVLNTKILEILEFGLIVDLNGMRGFIHISEIAWKKTSDLNNLFKIGDTVNAKIVDIDVNKRNVKLSLKALTKNPWDIVSETFKVGETVSGKVTRIAKFGAFVELVSGVEGLIHSSDFAWNSKHVNVNNFVKIGDEIKVSIIELNSHDRKLKLGIKQLTSNPWDDAETKFAVGTILSGKIVEVKQFGIFIQVEDGVDAFVHTSDFAWIGGSTKYNKDDIVEFKVIELHKETQKIKGSIKDLTKSPWEKSLEIYSVGDIVEKPIKNIQEFGLFIKLEDGVDGFIPTQLVSKNFIKNLKDDFNVGDIVKAEIIEINLEKQKIKLSMKKLQLDNEQNENKKLLEKYGVSTSDN